MRYPGGGFSLSMFSIFILHVLPRIINLFWRRSWFGTSPYPLVLVLVLVLLLHHTPRFHVWGPIVPKRCHADVIDSSDPPLRLPSSDSRFSPPPSVPCRGVKMQYSDLEAVVPISSSRFCVSCGSSRTLRREGKGNAFGTINAGIHPVYSASGSIFSGCHSVIFDFLSHDAPKPMSRWNWLQFNSVHPVSPRLVYLVEDCIYRLRSTLIVGASFAVGDLPFETHCSSIKLQKSTMSSVKRR